jgi:methionyl-tRNA synthetase
MMGLVQADIYVRFLRSCGQEVVYFCADEAHGLPITMAAAKQGLEPEALISRWYEAHRADFQDFGISVDWFHSTHSPENQHYVELIYDKLKAHGDIEKRKSEQAWCGTPPMIRESTSLVFKLSRHTDFLRELLCKPGFIDPRLVPQLESSFVMAPRDWTISSDRPYFGFAIPGEPDKYFFVWLDAPMGYIATTEKWARETGMAKSALDYWAEDSGARIIHFISKDLISLHALFWPTVLKVAGFKQPDALKMHGHLTVNDRKLSRRTLITARAWLEHLDPSYLRYFYAASLGSGFEDVDLRLENFRLRVNGELVNNVGNLVHRCLSLLAGNMLEKRLAPATKEGPGRTLVEAALALVPEVREAFEKLELRDAIRIIMDISQSANAFLQQAAPWARVKTDPEAARADLSDAAEVAYLLGALLTPVVPHVTEKLFTQLNAPPLSFEALATPRYPLLDRGRPVGNPEPLLPRLEQARVNALLEPRMPPASD